MKLVVLGVRVYALEHFQWLFLGLHIRWAARLDISHSRIHFVIAEAGVHYHRRQLFLGIFLG